ncbi:hypothetical protein GCM10007863_37470 [Dyella mobilis]|nr:hypothetical protein GCM10007863_37470 [Dyella mobilis]
MSEPVTSIPCSWVTLLPDDPVVVALDGGTKGEAVGLPEANALAETPGKFCANAGAANTTEDVN